MKTLFKSLLITAGLFTVIGVQAEKEKPVVKTTAEEQQAISQKQSDLVVVEHADGSRSIDLEGRFQMYSVAKLVDGKVVYNCQNKEHLDKHGIHVNHQPSRGVK